MNQVGIPTQHQVSISTVASNAALVEGWRYWALPAFVCVGCLLIAFRQTVLAMVHTWQSSKTYSHCFLIVPLFSYLIWIRRKELFSVRPRVNSWGLALLAGSALTWLLADLGEVRVAQEFALVAMVAAIVWAVLGFEVLRIVAFPLSFLLFTVPFGTSLVGPLQNFTAWFAVHALTLSNIPAVLESHTIFLPTSTWLVGETCGGIRYLFASCVVGIFYSSLVYRSQKRRLLFVLASIVVPVIANGTRAYGIVLLSYLTNYRLAAGVDHVIYGGVFFVAVEIALMSIGLRWREAPLEYAAPAGNHLIAGSAGLKTNQALMSIVVVAVLFATPPLGKFLWTRSAAAPGPDGVSVTVDPSWQEASSSNSWDPDFRTPDKQACQAYISAARHVDLCWAFYSSAHGAALEAGVQGYGNPTAWSRAAQRTEPVIFNGKESTIGQEILQSGTNFRQVWTIYWIDGEYTSSPRRLKYLETKVRLFGRSAATGIIMLESEDPVINSESAQQILENFLAHAIFSVSRPHVSKLWAGAAGNM